MSVMVNVQTEMSDRATVVAAFNRRFKNVKEVGDKLTASVRIPSRNYDVNVEVNLTNMSIRCDSDYKNELIGTVTEAYQAEEIIRAAENEGRNWEEFRNSDKELCIDVEWA